MEDIHAFADLALLKDESTERICLDLICLILCDCGGCFTKFLCARFLEPVSLRVHKDGHFLLSCPEIVVFAAGISLADLIAGLLDLDELLIHLLDPASEDLHDGKDLIGILSYIFIQLSCIDLIDLNVTVGNDR